MPRRYRPFLIALSWIALFGQASAAHPISRAQVRTLFPAVARVMLQRGTTIGLLGYCGRHFASLKHESRRTRKTWLQHNRSILRKATTLQDRLWQSLKQQQSGLKAETTILDSERLVQQTVHKKIHALSGYNPAQQHLICHHLIQAIRAGDWDVSHKQPNAYSVLQNFH